MTDETTREQRRQELETLRFDRGLQGGALMQPSNGRELMDLATMMSKSGQMVRDFYRGNPGDCAALIMICQPYGLNPYMVSWKTYKASKNADAPIAFEAQLVNAMVNLSAPVRGRLRYYYEGEGPARVCTVTGTDRETGDEISYKSPPIGKIRTKNSPLWQDDPDQQLGYYAARAWARRHFPELLLGVYTPDEIESHVGPDKAKDVTPGGFADAARKARDERPDPVEAEVVPVEAEDIDPEPQSDEPVRQIAEELEPEPQEEDISKKPPHWLEGRADHGKGKSISDCPYTDDRRSSLWKSGWKYAKQESIRPPSPSA